MASRIDILRLFPELAVIGPIQLQTYCHEWLRRPIAREFGFTQLLIDNQLLIYAAIDPTRAGFIGEKAYLPIDELLGYIIDRHFTDHDERRRLHAAVRDTRNRRRDYGPDYGVNIGRLGTLCLTCKNPTCHAIMETDQIACELDRITYGPINIECLTCGQTHPYDGRDFHLKIVS
jgi:hypothetical protein